MTCLDGRRKQKGTLPMKMQRNRWMKWVLNESAREVTPLPFARGARRAETIARRASVAPVPSRRHGAPLQSHAQA
jgi:hypothetical protein